MEKTSESVTHLVHMDTETTGTKEDDRLCQLAWITTDLAGNVIDTVNELYRPPVPVSIEAMSVNHITNKVLEDKPAFQESPECEGFQELLNRPGTVLVAHNAPFDVEMLAREKVNTPRFICTSKVIHRLDPMGEEGSKRLQYLRYKHDLDEPGATPHDALGDVIILKNLFFHILNKGADKAGIEVHGPGNEKAMQKLLNRFLEISQEPTLKARLPFGKYKGEVIAHVRDKSYLRWMVTKSSLDEDTKWTIKKYHFPDMLGGTPPGASPGAEPYQA